MFLNEVILRKIALFPKYHDLLLSKCVAGRGRDWGFVEEVLRHGLAEPGELRRRAADLPIAAAEVEAVQRMVEGVVSRSES
jgi:hypothetical protein